MSDDTQRRMAHAIEDAVASMDLRGLAAEAIRERDALHVVIDAATEKQREDALVHIRLRAALREALDAWEGLWRSEREGTTKYERVMGQIAELRKLVQS